MAKKRRSAEPTAIPWKPPTPAQMSEMAIKDAARQATMAHPHVQRMQKKIEAGMRKAAHGGMDFEKSGDSGKEW